jgi:catechol 2,3-dioxygenase
MPHARARLTAYFTDIDGNPLKNTTRHSELYAAKNANNPWHRLGFEMSADDPSAAFLVLELGLLQPAQYSEHALGQRELYAQDISGTAWFDDVSVAQVPRVTMTTSRPGAAFISAGGYHHHLGLNTWESLGGSPPAPGMTGLYHTAILYPTRRLLADALRRLIVAKIPLEGASDHGVSEALYLRDPDDNGVELYWDRPKEKWPKKPDGSLQMFTNPLDLHDLLAELDRAPA